MDPFVSALVGFIAFVAQVIFFIWFGRRMNSIARSTEATVLVLQRIDRRLANLTLSDPRLDDPGVKSAKLER